ncbi:Acg family FMN-binding oxidoreductase [Salinigranum salinum]|uniref:Acg family FMN-binding oxidoreductase n=1 Tax=Salinigranum salinum TaxID=1364937 RepID=UPI0012603F50|nr:nitroreductase [Salinigranum salinum]
MDDSDPWTVSREAFPDDGPLDAQLRFLLQYAILAPSSHNTQPWRFSIENGGVDVAVDEDRWLPVADSDRRELYISVGCALENLLVAAEEFGFEHDVTYVAAEDGPGVARVVLSPGGSRSPLRGGLFEALTERSTNHGPYYGSVSASTLAELERAVADPDLWIEFVEGEETKARLGELVTRADRRQFEDPAYRRELGEWIGNGALATSWLKAKLGQLAVTHLDLGDRQAATDSVLVEGAPVVVVLGSELDTRSAQVRVGQTFERLALLATVEGLSVHPMSQVLELPDLRAELTDALGIETGDTDDTAGGGGKVVQHLFRLGHADPERGHSSRRPLSAVLD